MPEHTHAGTGHRADPVLIGASGGSGTRAFSRILRHAGLYMGAVVDDQEDAKAFSPFYSRFGEQFLLHGGRFAPAVHPAADAAFDDSVRAHLATLPSPGTPWGAKNPRSLLLLPYWGARYPGLRFVHVVRSGLDMAYTETTNQLRRYGAAVLGDDSDALTPERKIALWQAVNLRAADYGESELAGRYLRVRLEDLVEDPAATVRELFAFAGAGPEADARAAADVVRRPPTLGRWREHPGAEVTALARLAREGLARFGYERDLDKVSLT